MRNFNPGEPTEGKPYRWKLKRISVNLIHWEILPFSEGPEESWMHRWNAGWLCFDIEWERVAI